jgi:hypothetical protein
MLNHLLETLSALELVVLRVGLLVLLIVGLLQVIKQHLR